MSSKLETEQFGQIVHWERDSGLRQRARGLSFLNRPSPEPWREAEGTQSLTRSRIEDRKCAANLCVTNRPFVAFTTYVDRMIHRDGGERRLGRTRR